MTALSAYADKAQGEHPTAIAMGAGIAAHCSTRPSLGEGWFESTHDLIGIVLTNAVVFDLPIDEHDACGEPPRIVMLGRGLVNPGIYLADVDLILDDG